MRKPFNSLTPAQAERLAWLIEELAEAQQAACKILRHGYTSGNPHRDNRNDLERELADVGAAMHLLVCAGDLRQHEVALWAAEQSGRHRDMHHQDAVAEVAA
jgi:hypothetical protein